MFKVGDEVVHFGKSYDVIGKVKARFPFSEGGLYMVVDAKGLEYLMLESELKPVGGNQNGNVEP